MGKPWKPTVWDLNCSPWALRCSRRFSKTVTWCPPSFSSMAKRSPTGPPAGDDLMDPWFKVENIPINTVASEGKYAEIVNMKQMNWVMEISHTSNPQNETSVWPIATKFVEKMMTWISLTSHHQNFLRCNVGIGIGKIEIHGITRAKRCPPPFQLVKASPDARPFPVPAIPNDGLKFFVRENWIG